MAKVLKNNNYNHHLQKITTIITQAIKDSKMLEVKTYQGSPSYFIDVVTIATGTSIRHIKGTADNIIKNCKQHLKIVPVVNHTIPDWISIDLGNNLIHLMTQAKRDYYQLDSLMVEYGNNPIQTN